MLRMVAPAAFRHSCAFDKANRVCASMFVGIFLPRRFQLDQLYGSDEMGFQYR